MTTNLLVLGAVGVQTLATEPSRQELTWLEAAGLPTPPTVLDVLKLIDQQPKPREILAAMVDDVASVNDQWLEEHLVQFQRATQLRAMHTQLEAIGRTMAIHRRTTTAGERFELLSGPITQALADLEAVVKVLPEGKAALHPEASIDAGTTDELAKTRSLLTRIGTMLGALPLERGTHYLNQWVIALLDVPEFERERIARNGRGEPLNPSEARDAVRSVRRVDDVDQLVVDVLRGEYAPLSLRFVSGRAEHQRRCERIHTADLVEIVDRART